MTPAREVRRRGPRSMSRVVAVLAALSAGGCPPPADRVRAGDPAWELPREGSGTPEVPAPPPPGPGGEPAPVAPAASSGTVPVVYEKLRSGIAVARCPACGTVPAKGAERCGACGQGLSAWRHEETCTRCAGDGRCDRCGDDRACLACDGDGRCAACGGTAGPGAAKCPECAGAGRCGSCVGDGLREHATRDFSPAEGWLPGTCATCIDASGLCPECGSSGKDRLGGACVTCGGGGACPDCGGDGACFWCGADGHCPPCEGSGVVVRNGATRGPDERVRRLRTAAGSPLTGRVLGAPTAVGMRVVVEDKDGRAKETVLPRTQTDPVTWLVALRDFAPGWDGRTAPVQGAATRHLLEVEGFASENSLWGPAQRALALVISTDPASAAEARARITALEARRAEAWTRAADDAARSGERDRALVLLEMAAFRARGTAIAARAGIRMLTIRKDRETEATAADDGERLRRQSEATASVARAVSVARARLARAFLLTQRATQAASPDPSADRTFSRAEYSAWFARRTAEAAAARAPAASVDWPTAPAALVTESRLVSASVLEAWAAQAIGGGRYALGLRLARRGALLDPSRETLKALVAQAENGIAREGVLQGTPAPGSR